MSFDDADDVAPARSPRSTSRTERPRPAASRAIPTPLIPPPTTSRSTGGTAPSPAATLVVDILSNRHILPSGGHIPRYGSTAYRAQRGVSDTPIAVCFRLHSISATQYP